METRARISKSAPGVTNDLAAIRAKLRIYVRNARRDGSFLQSAGGAPDYIARGMRIYASKLQRSRTSVAVGRCRRTPFTALRRARAGQIHPVFGFVASHAETDTARARPSSRRGADKSAGGLRRPVKSPAVYFTTGHGTHVGM